MQRHIVLTTPTTDTRVSHRRKRTLRSDIRDGPTGEEEETKKKRKRQKITPSPLPPTAWVDDLNGVERGAPCREHHPIASGFYVSV
jgi:hypothetical protein